MEIIAACHPSDSTTLSPPHYHATAASAESGDLANAHTSIDVATTAVTTYCPPATAPHVWASGSVHKSGHKCPAEPTSSSVSTAPAAAAGTPTPYGQQCTLPTARALMKLDHWRPPTCD
mmetsp:Transcript_78436/g.151533  ORF Transcript_78436/g.151533 Transcript_78436/m.151533 type:complete len:119 (-) Transcript_78436:546-902(-)